MYAITAKIIPQLDNVNKAGIPSNLAILGLQAIEGLGITARVERASEKGLQRSFLKATSIDKLILLDNNSIGASRALNKLVNTRKL